jgi:beta-N-acetylhexosaminidase
MSFKHRFIFIPIILLLATTPLYAGAASPSPQVSSPADQASALLEKLTPEERVGQLFLVTFNGTDAGPDSPIYDLVVNHYIGGVVLLASNDNFISGGQILNQTLTLNRELQLDRWAASQNSRTNPITNETFTPSFIPLFIGIQQEGDGAPYDQLLSGLTPLPNEMAIGSTWNPEMANKVGNVTGKELSALGFNMLLGPSLDVLQNPHTEGPTDLGTRTFGGDPFWVSQMGTSFISGVHQGSSNRMAVMAKYFPGQGAADRLPEEEVSTIIKTLDQLKSDDLKPFFSVTGNAPSQEATTDGLIASHIRIQGFQGNLRSTTRPISLDPQAFNLLMSLPPLDAWRKNGGVVMSDNLGSQAVRGFYNVNSQPFDPVRVARSAFLAGNDLLYMADFSSDAEPDSNKAAISTLTFFAQKYREDAAFAKLVDQSVLRILTLKFRLDKNFSLTTVLPSPNITDQVGVSSQVPFDVAQEGATLISPDQTSLQEAIPDPPNLSDHIVFITDVLTSQQCSKCPNLPELGVREFQDVVIRRYGPLAGRQVNPTYLSSYSTVDLQQMLDLKQGDNSDIERDLSRANWIIFSMLNVQPGVPSYNALSRFLSERPDLIQQKRLIVFAFNAPYYLDATNITKLTAYFGMYSKVPQFVDMAAYLLFGERRAQGASPVSIPGVRYDLNEALFPNPSQVIQLEQDLPSQPISGTATAPAPTSTPVLTPTPYRIGSLIPIRTGTILDHNGHPVPDGTPVEFIFSIGSDQNSTSQVETTVNGVAHTSYQVTSPGALVVRARSEPATQSTTLKFDIPSQDGVTVTPSPTAQPTHTPTPSPTVTLTPSPIPVTPEKPTNLPRLADWLIALMVTATIAWSTYRLGSLIGQVRWGIRGGFLALIGGLSFYSYLILQLPGSERVLRGSIARGVFLATLVGAGIGLLIALLWRAVGIRKSGKEG